MPLAQSMGDPPPKATTASGRKARRAATPLATSSREGSGSTWLNTSTGPVSRSAARLTRPEVERKPSVTSSTRFPASCSRAASAPGPNQISGLIANRSIPVLFSCLDGVSMAKESKNIGPGQKIRGPVAAFLRRREKWLLTLSLL